MHQWRGNQVLYLFSVDSQNWLLQLVARLGETRKPWLHQEEKRQEATRITHCRHTTTQFYSGDAAHSMEWRQIQRWCKSFDSCSPSDTTVTRYHSRFPWHSIISSQRMPSLKWSRVTPASQCQCSTGETSWRNRTQLCSSTLTVGLLNTEMQRSAATWSRTSWLKLSGLTHAMSAKITRRHRSSRNLRSFKPSQRSSISSNKWRMKESKAPSLWRSP